MAVDNYGASGTTLMSAEDCEHSLSVANFKLVKILEF